MSISALQRTSFAPLVLAALFLLAACNPSATNPVQPAATLNAAAATSTPDWFNVELTDARTGKSFTINDFAGQVVLVETMAMWCANCLVQASEVRDLHEVLGSPDDLVSVSLDVDVNENQAALKDYVEEWGFDWYFAVAPLEVARALGNLYSAQYLNPPLSPMLIIDRTGNVYPLEYGPKNTELLQTSLDPYLTN